jgi:hypothetical protein
MGDVEFATQRDAGVLGGFEAAAAAQPSAYGSRFRSVWRRNAYHRTLDSDGNVARLVVRNGEASIV